jgi:Peptidase family M23
MNFLKIIFLLILFQISGSTLFSQAVIDSVEVCGLPVRKGVAYRNDFSSGEYTYKDQFTSVLTQYDSVFHIGDGNVVAIHNYGDDNGGYAIIIRNEKDEFICYSNLRYVSLKKGDVIKKGTWLGFAGTSEVGKRKQVDFMFFKKNKKLPFQKEVEYIRCGISCDQPQGYTL